MNEQIDSILNYLKMVRQTRSTMRKPPGWKYNGMEDFLLRHGRAFEYKPLPRGVKRGVIKQCFANSYKLAKRRGWNYCEGVALGSIIPVHHAWVENPKKPGIVIDPTWESGEAYFGTAFRLEAVASASALDDWQNGWPLFAGRLDWELRT